MELKSRPPGRLFRFDFLLLPFRDNFHDPGFLSVRGIFGPDVLLGGFICDLLKGDRCGLGFIKLSGLHEILCLSKQGLGVGFEARITGLPADVLSEVFLGGVLIGHISAERLRECEYGVN